MVVGGGISGVQTALDLAESGFKVYMVESKPSIGGVMAQLDKTFPTNDCSIRLVFEFGFVTIPWMALTVFAALALITFLARKENTI